MWAADPRRRPDLQRQPAMETATVFYRPVDDRSEGVEVTESGLRKLITRRVLDPDGFQYRRAGTESWRHLGELTAAPEPPLAPVESVSTSHALIRCPHCRRPFRLDQRQELAGKRAQCNSCRGVFVLPEPGLQSPTPGEHLAPPVAPPVDAPVDLVCANCGTAHPWRWELEGKTVRCRNCRATFVAEPPPGAVEQESESDRVVRLLNRMVQVQKDAISEHRDAAINFVLGGLGLIALAAIASWFSGRVMGNGMVVFYGLAIVGLVMMGRGTAALWETLSKGLKAGLVWGPVALLVFTLVGVSVAAAWEQRDRQDRLGSSAPAVSIGAPDERAGPGVEETAESEAAAPSVASEHSGAEQPTMALEAGAEEKPRTPAAADAVLSPHGVAPTEGAAAPGRRDDAAPAPRPQPLDYLPMRAGTEWTYRRTIPESCTVPFSPTFLNSPGVLGHSATHGCWRFPDGEESFSIRVIAVRSSTDAERIGVIATSDVGSITWLPPVNLAERRLRIVANRAGFAIAFEGLFDANEPDGLGVGCWWARENHFTREVSVPAGTFPKARQFTEHHYATDFTPAFTTRSWIAPFVGLVKYELMDADRVVLMTVELTRHVP
ncbi:MAG: hypothetical protein KDC98_11480 [Planctomycetes bacterium]|nr:hypothetical protein [Planctomycetota bacterium]